VWLDPRGAEPARREPVGAEARRGRHGFDTRRPAA
ncbi:pyridoxamine 5'-phosphate oxidase, partial [Micromonospora aurantiaca]|nr:pyridoxamine 5'-phosphate oxidase [Micromonospora aurantiaca]